MSIDPKGLKALECELTKQINARAFDGEKLAEVYEAAKVVSRKRDPQLLFGLYYNPDDKTNVRPTSINIAWEEIPIENQKGEN